MILVDTNILIDCFKATSTEDLNILYSGNAAICGVVESEFIRGTRSEAEIAWLDNLLSIMTYVEVEHSDWRRIGLFMRSLREKGIAVPMPDGIISYLAIKHNLEVWTHDRHFLLIAAVMPDLKLLNA